MTPLSGYNMLLGLLLLSSCYFDLKQTFRLLTRRETPLFIEFVLGGEQLPVT
jgi:hypothetical protein